MDSINWLSRLDKSIPVPCVVIAPMEFGGSGCYYTPRPERIEIGDRCYPADRGLIQVDPEYPEHHAGVLAHEWRHHWQRFNRYRAFPNWPWENVSDYESYKKAIRSYFRAPWELDALRFEYRIGRNWHNQQMMEIIEAAGPEKAFSIPSPNLSTPQSIPGSAILI